MPQDGRGNFGNPNQHKKAGQASQRKGGHKLTNADRSKGGRVSSRKQDMSKLGEMGAKARWNKRGGNS